MNDEYRQTGRTTEMLLRMLVSKSENNYYVSLNHLMSKYHRDMFLDILEGLKFNFEANLGNNIVKVGNKTFNFTYKEYIHSKYFRNNGVIYFDHTCIG